MQSGAVYVFVKDGESWIQQAYIKASNTESNDQFGFSVDISGDTLVVGANFESSSSQGVDGDQLDNSSTWSGAVYVFTHDAGIWSQQAYLKASNNQADMTGVNPGRDQFGGAVSIFGDTLAVGALGECQQQSKTGVNGEQDNNNASLSGAVYVFTRDANVWSQQAYIKASNAGAGDVFGDSVKLYADTLVVGASGEQSNATGINSDQNNNSLFNAGAVYVFTRTQDIWSQQAYIKASNTGEEDRFGKEVDIYEDTLLVSAPWEQSNSTGINGDQEDNSADFSGAAYVFTRSEGVWSQQAYLKASNNEVGDEFSFDIAIYKDNILIGAHGEDSAAKGVNGDQSDNSVSGSGAAYLFSRQDDSWSQSLFIKASNTDASDTFGSSVVLNAETLTISARGESSASAGINGDQFDNSALGAGAVYVFDSDVIFKSGFE